MNTFRNCDICLFDCNDPVEYGEIFEKLDIKVHYYCLLLSTHLPQRGKNGSGILGFLVADIRNEIKEAASRFCCYCKAKNASIKCYSCDVYFHLKCALEENCLLQFFDEFKSYCHEHHNIKHSLPHTPETGCFICRKKMGNYNSVTSITSDCCSTNGWVHRKCLKIYALAAGYYLKCLWCTSPTFRDYVRLHGIFVPDRDAEWERIRGAYAELYENVRKKCLAVKCICPRSREFQNKKWEVDVCVTCGAFTSHRLCRTDIEIQFICKTCKEISVKTKNLITLMSRSRSQFDTTLFVSKSQLPMYSLDISGANSTMNCEDLCTISSDSEQEIDWPESNIKLEKIENIGEINKVLFVYNKNTMEVLGFVKSTDIKDEEEFRNAIKKNKNIEDKINFFKDSSEADKLLKKLIEEHLKNKKTDPDEIVISDSDSDVSVSKLLDKLERKDNIPVPKPKNLFCNKNDVRDWYL